MSDSELQQPDFESVRTRLAEIADAVDDENLPLDDALDLYEEAVALGLKATDLLEIGVAADEEESEEVASENPDDAESSDDPENTGVAAD